MSGFFALLTSVFLMSFAGIYFACKEHRDRVIALRKKVEEYESEDEIEEDEIEEDEIEEDEIEEDEIELPLPKHDHCPFCGLVNTILVNKIRIPSACNGCDRYSTFHLHQDCEYCHTDWICRSQNPELGALPVARQ